MHRSVLHGLTAAAIFSCFCNSAFAQDIPKRRPGLWDTTLQGAQLPQPINSQQCIDEKTDIDLQNKAMQTDGKSCTQKNIKRVAGGYEFNTVCKHGASTVTSNGSVTDDFNTNYKAVVNSTFDPPQNGMKETSMTIQGKHAGACPPDMKPGDIRFNGVSINLSGQGGQGVSKADVKNMMEQMKKQMEQQKK